MRLVVGEICTGGEATGEVEEVLDGYGARGRNSPAVYIKIMVFSLSYRWVDDVNCCWVSVALGLHFSTLQSPYFPTTSHSLLLRLLEK